MTKVELIAKVAADAELTKKDAEKAVNAVLEGITAALKAGDKVSLVGFGTFETRKRPERTGRNPRTKVTSADSKTGIGKFPPRWPLRSRLARP